ncbi:histone deacetylase 15 isoform X2 [Telopea speciosissima]|uniref:histone deacetylase 15 isoform X2 n=1 Tax=Telopea speciosissima TaxID=54955 RepID=UPI001CC79E99|nr:histone deacetylase 15 isoform X2 [Telopea speciosissima]
MDSEAVQTSSLKNGGAEGSLYKQSERVQCQSSGYLNGSRRSSKNEGISTDPPLNENYMEQEECEIHSRDMDSNGSIRHDHATKKPRHQKDLTFQDMYSQQEGYFEDDDDDDSDWEPLQKHVASKKWFCTNCTMMNLDDDLHCDICGEYKESEIVRHGFFASRLAPTAFHSRVETEVIDRLKDSVTRKSDRDNCTVIGFDERMLLHSEVEMKSHPHPERPDRLRAIAASLASAGIFPGRCISIPAREISREELQPVHSLEHIEAVDLTSRMLSSYFTPDTYANEHSASAARLAAGLCADIASTIMTGNAKNGFALVRPPGHHAGVRQAMGFCLHNNAAVAALAAQSSGAKKVLIVDWDVHHGNGTQEIFEANKSVLYISLHRHEGGRFYPGTGAADEVGIMDAAGYSVNIPWKCGGVGDNDYLFAFQHIVLPIALEFSPDFTIISAGFDAARGDPLGCCDVTPAGFAQMAHLLSAFSSGKLLVILEGGYNLRSISSSATAVIKVLLGETPVYEVDHVEPSKVGWQTVLEVLGIQMNFWSTLKPTFTRLQSQWASFLQNRTTEIYFVENMEEKDEKGRGLGEKGIV